LVAQKVQGNDDNNENLIREERDVASADNYINMKKIFYREDNGVLPNKQAGRNLINATNKRIELDRKEEDNAENISDLDV